MKLFQIVFLQIIILLLSSCITEIQTDTQTEFQQEENKDLKMYFKVLSRGAEYEYDDGTQKEKKVESLHLAFYDRGNGVPALRKTVKASKSPEEGIFTIHGSFGSNHPDFVIGIANYNESEVSMTDPLFMSSEELISEKGFLMSSVSYFNSEELVYYTELKDENFPKDESSVPETIVIELERLASKVTFKKSSDLHTPAVTVNHGGDLKTLKLTITGWSVNATERATYLVKERVPYSEYEEELGLNGDAWSWNKESASDEPAGLHWAHSLNYDKNKFPGIGKESEAQEVIYRKYSDFSNLDFYESEEEERAQYFHETTRRSSLFDESNALPSIMMAGFYTLGEGIEPKTFYLLETEDTQNLFTEDEYVELMWKRQACLYHNNEGRIEKISLEEFKDLISEMTPAENVVHQVINPSYVSPQIKAGVRLEGLCDAAGNPYNEDVTKLNEMLYQNCGLMQKFKDGKCVFLAPIEHFGLIEKDGTMISKTGSYGLVRNNYYNVTLQSVEGLGHGIPDEDMTIGDFGDSPGNATYTLGIVCRVLPWHRVEGEIN